MDPRDEDGTDEGDDPFVFDGEIDDEFGEPYADGVANRSHPFDAVTCLDWPLVRGEAAFTATAARISAAAPRFGPGISWAQASCLYWGAEPVGLLVPGAGDVIPLVVSTTHDPATPLIHARSVAQRLGAPLLTVDSASHVIFPAGTACVDDIVSTYLITAVSPRDKNCPMPFPPSSGGG